MIEMKCRGTGCELADECKRFVSEEDRKPGERISFFSREPMNWSTGECEKFQSLYEDQDADYGL